MPRFFTVASTLERKRSVSKIPGSMKLMVTLSRRPCAPRRRGRRSGRRARRTTDRGRRSASSTDPDVMLTMRPNFFATIGSIAFWISSTATIMLAMTPSSIFCRSSSRKSRNGGPALLLTRISGSGQAANKAFWPSGEATSAATGDDLRAGRLAQFLGRRGKLLLVAAVDHDLAAGFGQRDWRRRARARGWRRRRSPCGRQFQDPSHNLPCILSRDIARRALCPVLVTEPLASQRPRP